MNKSSELFELVNSMSRSEKRYFQQFGSQHVKGKRNDYMILFDAMVKQTIYNEQKLKAVLMKKGCRNEFRHTKHYLYNQILRALQAYHHSSSKYEELKSILASVKLLHRKGLHDQSRNQLMKAKKIAVNHEFFGDLADIHNWEIRLMYNTQNYDDRERIFEEAEELNDELQNVRMFQKKTAEVHVFHLSEYIIKSKKRDKELEKVMLNFPEDLKRALTYTSRENFYRIFTTYYRMKNDVGKSLDLRRELIQLMEDNEFLFKEERLNYLLASTNLLNGLFDDGLLEEALTLSDKIVFHSQDLKDKVLKLDVILKCYNIELSIKMRIGDFEGVRKVLTKINECERGHDISLVKAQLFKVSEAYAYFCLGNYSDAVKRSYQIINVGPKLIGSGNYTSAQLINLLAHFELGNQEQLIYYTKNTYRSLKSLDQLNKLEKSLLSFLRKLADLKSGEIPVEHYKTLRTELLSFLNEHYERIRFENFFYLGWLDQKIDNINLEEALKRRYEEFGVTH